MSCTLTDPVVVSTATIVDGGVLSNFQSKFRPHRRATAPLAHVRGPPAPGPARGPGRPRARVQLPTLPIVRLLQQVATALVGRDQAHLKRPGVRDMMMTVDTRGTEIVEFRIRASEREASFQSGQRAAQDFLQRWTRRRHDVPG